LHFGGHVVAAVGVDERGEKHVLGMREGATENEPPACVRCRPIWSSAV
jgi:transposase-like protein